MKYFEAIFTLSPFSDDAADLLAALLGECGYESFETTSTSLRAYVQQQLLEHDALQAVVNDFPMPGVSITYTLGEAQYCDWNEQWEQEGFTPIVVSGERKVADGERHAHSLVIHDGRHLPQDDSLTSRPSLLTSIEIDARMAFGTGTHQTTRLICQALLSMPLDGLRVLDAGCGTGILGICALKLGAASCTAYDIDEWSADNTRHNAVINHVDERITALCGDASLLDDIEGCFDVVVANINRNILLQDMPCFAAKMHKGSQLLLSGFYEEDGPLLKQKADELNLRLVKTACDESWCMLQFERD
jgi:ribosomal protein L11 methyltransferase